MLAQRVCRKQKGRHCETVAGGNSYLVKRGVRQQKDNPWRGSQGNHDGRSEPRRDIPFLKLRQQKEQPTGAGEAASTEQSHRDARGEMRARQHLEWQKKYERRRRAEVQRSAEH